MSNPVPTITYTPCESSQISGFGYDAATQTLGVEFPGKGPAPGSRYHYAGCSQALYDEFASAESKGKFFGANIRGKLPFEKQPEVPGGVVFGLTLAQTSKYTTASTSGRITVRATGKPIPDDEPVFILRASDTHACDVLEHYLQFCECEGHAMAIEKVSEQFAAWQIANPGRVKEPDTSASA